METHEQQLYTRYEGAPIILKPENISGDISQGKLLIHFENAQEIEIPSSQYYDMVPATMEGLFEDLIPGSPLKEKLLEERELFKAHGQEPNGYGVLVWYPHSKNLVRFMQQFWHRTSLLVRNKTLYQDSEMKLSWQEVRERFEDAVVAIAGGSLGNNVAHAIAWDIRPRHIKIADFKEFHMANCNRVRISYEDIGKNKAEITARQLHGIDPFMDISVFSEGIHEENIEDFITGNLNQGEPPATVIIEEIDEIRIKFLIRQVARKHGIPVVMASDIGSATQLDVRRFDINPRLPLFGCGVPDEESLKALEVSQTTKKEEDFMKLFLDIVGPNCLQIPEFKQLMLNGLSQSQKDTPPVVKETPPLFKGLPQLGSTALLSAALATDAAARIVLGYRLPERTFFDKRNGTSITEGELL